MKYLLFVSIMICLSKIIQASDWYINGGEVINSNSSNFGIEVGMSGDGNLVVACGSQKFGYCYAYRFNSDQQVWDLDGTFDLTNEITLNYKTISVSGDGSTVAFGAKNNLETFGGNIVNPVIVYKRDATSWVQKGSLIGETTSDIKWITRPDSTLGDFGRAISLTQDGSIIAIGCPGFTIRDPSTTSISYIVAGSYTILKYIDNDWVVQYPLGKTVGEENIHYGKAVSISVTNIAIASNKYVDVRFHAGNLMGSAFSYQFSSSYYGYFCSVSEDGTTVAVSDGNYDKLPFNNRGKIGIYMWDGTNWNLRSNEILGDREGAFFGRYLKLSSDGDAILFGSVINNTAMNLHVLEWNGYSWVHRGNSPLTTQKTRSISFSSDGYSFIYGNKNENSIIAYKKDPPTPSPTLSPSVSPTTSPTQSPTTAETGRIDTLKTKTITRTARKMTGNEGLLIAKNIIEATKTNANISSVSETLCDGSKTITYSDLKGKSVQDGELALQSIFGSCERCTITATSNRRLLAFSNSITYTITYELSGDAFSSIESLLADDQIKLQLETDLGIENLELVDSTSELVVSVNIIGDKLNNSMPLTYDAIDGYIDILENSVTSIIEDVNQNLNISNYTIETVTVNRCDGRNCNGRGGPCNPDTGICESCDDGYMGYDCEYNLSDMGCSGTNGVPFKTYCECNYPYYGLICEKIIENC